VTLTFIARPFSSHLFRRLLAIAVVTFIALFALLYAVSVPFIQASAEASEESAAMTTLGNVHEMLEQISRDLDNYRQAMLSARRQELRDIISITESRARRLDSEVQSGNLSRQAAKRRLLSELRDIRFGQNDYIWASNNYSVLISHPDAELNNADFSQKRDTRGNLIVPPMIEGALSSGEGFHSYWWRRLGEDKEIEKLSFYKHIPEFELVIGTGLYIDDIEMMVAARRATAIEDLRRRVKTLRIARTGYIYLFDGGVTV
jgi:two-component system cell cycle sensor histidine kinase/response regulator CckA